MPSLTRFPLQLFKPIFSCICPAKDSDPSAFWQILQPSSVDVCSSFKLPLELLPRPVTMKSFSKFQRPKCNSSLPRILQASKPTSSVPSFRTRRVYACMSGFQKQPDFSFPPCYSFTLLLPQLTTSYCPLPPIRIGGILRFDN